MNFVGGAIHDAVEEGTDRNDGVCFEKYLGDTDTDIRQEIIVHRKLSFCYIDAG